ncbi:TRAP transporter substrate-binding protein DctP [Chloroflexota bacterium]
MKKKGIWILASLIVTLGLVIGALGCAAPAATPTPTATPTEAPKPVISIKYDTYQTPTNRDSVCHQWFFDQLIERSAKLGYTVEVEYYWAQALSPTGRQLYSVRDGIAQAAQCSEGYYPSQLPLHQGLNPNYVSMNEAAFALAQGEVYNTHYPLQYEWEVKNNVKVLAIPPSGEVTMWLKEGQTAFGHEDLAGLKIRAYGQTGACLELLGATPVGIPFPDTYEAIERGVVDGAFGVPFGVAANAAFYEVAPVIVETGAGHYADFPLIFNLQFYDNLPQEIKDIITGLGPEMVKYTISYNQQDDTNAVETCHAAGSKFIYWSDDAIAAAAELVQPAQAQAWADRVAEKGFDGMDLYNTLVSKVRALEPVSAYTSAFDYWRATYPEDEIKP